MPRRAARGIDDEPRPEYDLTELKGGVRGKYHKLAKTGSNLVLIDPDLSTYFPDAEAVNTALRLLLVAARVKVVPIHLNELRYPLSAIRETPRR